MPKLGNTGAADAPVGLEPGAAMFVTAAALVAPGTRGANYWGQVRANGAKTRVQRTFQAQDLARRQMCSGHVKSYWPLPGISFY